MLDIFSRYRPFFGAERLNVPFSLLTPPATYELSVLNSCTVVCIIGSLVSLSTMVPAIFRLCAVAVSAAIDNSAINKVLFMMICSCLVLFIIDN